MVRPAKRRAGEYREVATIYDPAKVTVGLNQQLEDPQAILSDVPCAIIPMGGDSVSFGGIQTVEGATHVVEMCWQEEFEILPSYFLVWNREPFGNKRLDILNVRDPDGYRRKLLLFVKQVPLADIAAANG